MRFGRRRPTSAPGRRSHLTWKQGRQPPQRRLALRLPRQRLGSPFAPARRRSGRGFVCARRRETTPKARGRWRAGRARSTDSGWMSQQLALAYRHLFGAGTIGRRIAGFSATWPTGIGARAASGERWQEPLMGDPSHHRPTRSSWQLRCGRAFHYGKPPQAPRLSGGVAERVNVSVNSRILGLEPPPMLNGSGDGAGVAQGS